MHIIPELDDNGYLPPGIHPATLDEIAERFGRDSEIRRVEIESLGWLVDLARQAGVVRIVIDGSFITDVFETNNVDCVLLIGPAGYPSNPEAQAEIRKGLPFIQALIGAQKAFDYYVNTVYGSDRFVEAHDQQIQRGSRPLRSPSQVDFHERVTTMWQTCNNCP